jgi:hemoglobin
MSELSQTPAPAPRSLLADTGASITEDNIHRLVHGFYDEVRADALLGPVFGREIAPEAWPVHLAKMCDFWSSVLLRTARYDGRPLPPHLRMPDLSDTHFARWLTLFRATADAVFAPADANRVIALAERIGTSFRLSIALHRGEDTMKVGPLPRG